MKEVLPRGTRAAIEACKLRVPAGVPEPLAELADEAFGRIVQVMRGSNHRYQGVQLSAARAVREEICGPLAQRMEHTGANGEKLVVEIRDLEGEADAEKSS